MRSLAQRSGQAAKDISQLIQNQNSQVKDGVDLVNRAGSGGMRSESAGGASSADVRPAALPPSRGPAAGLRAA